MLRTLTRAQHGLMRLQAPAMDATTMLPVAEAAAESATREWVSLPHVSRMRHAARLVSETREACEEVKRTAERERSAESAARGRDEEAVAGSRSRSASADGRGGDSSSDG